MKRFIAIALFGAFSFIMVGALHSSFDDKSHVESVLKYDHSQFVALMDAKPVEIKAYDGESVELSYEVESFSGIVDDVPVRANGPPTIRKL